MSLVQIPRSEYSPAMLLKTLPESEQRKILSQFSPTELQNIQYDWKFWARPKQYKPISVFLNDEHVHCLITSGRGFGKMLDLNTEIPVREGFKSMKDIRVGDIVFDEQGKECSVLFVSDVETPLEAYRVWFDDGSFIDACADHQWVTWTHRERKQHYRKGNKKLPTYWIEYQSGKEVFGGVKTTKELLDSLSYGKRNDLNHAIPLTQPIQGTDKKLPVSPYVLGVWLGDGSKRDACVTQEQSDQIELRPLIEAEGFETTDHSCVQNFGILGLLSKLKTLGVQNNKHIPENYLTSSFTQRLELLKGLMDTDGHVSKNNNSCEFSQSDKNLAHQVAQLICSLGMKCTIKSRIPVNTTTNKRGQENWRVVFTATLPVFKLKRKLSRLVFHDKLQQSKLHHRMIVNVEPINPVPMRCITVDSPSSMYLATKNYIPTHNTRIGAEWVRYVMERGIYSLGCIVGQTVSTVRRDMIKGDAGILNVCPIGPDGMPKVIYEPSKMTLTWPAQTFGLKRDGVINILSADDPDRLRGLNNEFIWADELASWDKVDEAWDMLMFTLRKGHAPKVLITSTPQPLKLLAELIQDPDTLLIEGSTYENAGNLNKRYVQKIIRKYEGTELGRQEIHGELLKNMGGLFKPEYITRINENKCPEFIRTVLAIDPATTSKLTSNDTAIAVASKGVDGNYYLRRVEANKWTPEQWAEKVAELNKEYHPHCIVAEINQGGEMVETTLRQVSKDLPIKVTHTSKGKDKRAEPVSLLYGKGRVLHVRYNYIHKDREVGGTIGLRKDEAIQEAEKQMFIFKNLPNEENDKVDAVVYAIRELSESEDRDFEAPAVSGYRKPKTFDPFVVI